MVVSVAADDAELVSDLLWGFAPAAIEEQAAPTPTLVLIAGFDDPGRAHDAADAVASHGTGPVEVRTVLDDGLDTWRDTAVTWSAPPFLLVPSWRDAEPRPGVILLDPGRTFGSGSHPTTRLVLGRMGVLFDAEGGPVAGEGTAPPDVLDVGCGSGVLSIAAALLGAATVTAIDVDPAAPEVTATNAERNGVADVVAASATTLAEVAATGRTFDVVVANLLAPVLVDLAPDLSRVLAPWSALVVSGLLADRWEATTERFEHLRVSDVAVDDGWAAVTLIHQPTS